LNIAPYPTYQPSGVEWLGNIPKDWSVKRLKWSVDGCFNGVWGDEPDGIDDVVCLRVADFNRDNYTISTEALTLRAIEAKQLESRKLKRGDLLIEKSGGGEKQLVGCVVYFDHEFDAVCSNFVARMPVAEGHLPRYWAYVHAGLYAGKLNYPAIKQTTGIQNLDAALYLDTLAAYPPLAEQQQIAAFLDWKTSQIDALIAKKQALLQKLKEKRLAVITQAVTKGLNPDAPMRDSGIAWLGEVPEHWQTKRLRHCAGLVTSGSRGWAQHFADTGSLFLRITNLTRDSIQLLLDDLQRVEPPEGAEGDRTFTKPGDLLISITADLGSVAVIPEGLEGAYVSQHLSLVRLDSEDIESRWIAYSILSHIGKHQLVGAGYGGTKVQLSLADIKEIVFCHPPTRDEQKRVLEFIQAETAKSDELISLAESAITRLTEYRSALITAATTGKIDVRGWQAPQETV
jgi:type I restriction enzyme S subunit